MTIRRGLVVLMVAGACLFGIGVVPAFAAGPPVPGAFVGYGATPRTGSANTFQSVTATWTIPDVTCSGPQSLYQGVALGKGNALDRTNPQGGEGAGIYTFCNSAGSTPINDTAFNAGGIPQVHSAVSAGDTITATVSYSSDSNEYTFTVADLNNPSYSINGYTYACQGTCSNASAWVSLSGDSASLPSFGQVNFTGVQVTDSSGHVNGLNSRDWTIVPVEYLYGGQIPGPLRQDKSAFSVKA